MTEKYLAAGVAVENTAYHFDKLYDYAVPDDMRENARPGCRVMISFGHGALRQGMIMELHEIDDISGLKTISELIDREPVLTPELVGVALSMSERCFCTLFEACKAMLPAGLSVRITYSYRLAGRSLSEREERSLSDTERQIIAAVSAAKSPIRQDRLIKSLGLDGDSLGAMPVLSELYGHEVTSLLDRDHNRLIIWSGALEKRKEPLVVDTPTSSMDILPTLLNLFGAEWDSRLLPGRDVFSDRDALVFDINYDWKTELGTYLSDGDTFIPAEGATIPEGYVEQMHNIVADKIRYCSAVLESDYYRHVFGEPEDVNAANAAGKKALEGETSSEDKLAGDIIRRFKAKHHFK